MNHYSNLLCIHSDLDGIANEVLNQYFDLPFNKTVSFDYDFFNELDKLPIFTEADNIVFSDISPPKEFYDRLILMGNFNGKEC
jgi:hypothetical protein